jgi:hypothetical protein
MVETATGAKQTLNIGGPGGLTFELELGQPTDKTDGGMVTNG